MCFKKAFVWTTECEAAFRKLKEVLSSAPVLAYPRFGTECEFILETDASYIGLGLLYTGKFYFLFYALNNLLISP